MSEINGLGSNNNQRVSKKSGDFNAVFTDKKDKSVKVDDFLNLMVKQLANQDFMNPVDDTQYLAQLAQFATMQQMQELASYSKSNYVMSLFGKDVTVAKIGLNGKVDKTTGPIEKVSLTNNEYSIYVKGKPFTLEQIMEVHASKVKGESSVDTVNKAIGAKDITTDSASFEWPSAISNELFADKVKYSVYYSTDSKFGSVEEVEKNGKLIGEQDRTSLTSESIKGLDSDTAYYVNVVVTDENNVKTVYQKAIFKTLKKE
ncbi:MAG: flagellar hook capping FlgD N-terminal domain-containing protein [Oscillospiraceae bacterium]